MSLLLLTQNRSRLRRELSRRIGYTNGLHDIFRFARVVSYLHPIAPASGMSLRGAIIQQEAIQGRKYADGVIDVAAALGLLAKTAGKLTLADRGFALHAVGQMENQRQATTALLLHAVLERDGDATLNLLDILATGAAPEDVGHMLMTRLFQVLNCREQWAQTHIQSKLAKDMVINDLQNSKDRLAAAVELSHSDDRSLHASNHMNSLRRNQKDIQRFYDHTINPRRTWLKDLGCVDQPDRACYTITEEGDRMLNTFKQSGCYMGSVFVLPFSLQVSQLLGLSSSDHSTDLLWQSTITHFRSNIASSDLSSIDYLALVKRIYPHVRLPMFNEATVDSIYEAILAQFAISGQYIDRQDFVKNLTHLSREHPDKIYQLRSRQDGSGYIALRGYTN